LLQTHHKEEFDNLLAKWRVAYPETVEWVCCAESGNGRGSGSSGLYGAHKHNQQHQYRNQQHGVAPVAQAVPVNNSNVNYLPYTASAGATPSGYVYQPTAYHNAKGGGGSNPPPMNPSYTGE
jgi:hypothetical protein